MNVGEAIGHGLSKTHELSFQIRAKCTNSKSEISLGGWIVITYNLVSYPIPYTVRFSLLIGMYLLIFNLS